MLERMARFYGKEAAANERPRNADADYGFSTWAIETLKGSDLEGDEFMNNLDHMINCWEDGYDAYKRGDVI